MEDTTQLRSDLGKGSYLGQPTAPALGVELCNPTGCQADKSIL